MHASSPSRYCVGRSTWRCARVVSCETPTRACRRIEMCKFDVQGLQARHDRATFAVADHAAIDLSYGNDACERAGHEGFLGTIHIGQAEIAFARGNVGFPADAQNIRTGDAAKAVVAARSPNLALP